ncbi:MAG: hypothetical protein ACE5KA_05280 [Nitrososphaerales archaeon]
MDASELKHKIRQAREAVQDEPDPYKLEAFKVILARLIEEGSIGEILPEGALSIRGKRDKIPYEIMQRLHDLKYKERIQVLLYYQNRTLTREEIKEKAKELGVDEGWWNGSNFKRDLMKRSKVLLEKKDSQGSPRYRLSNVGEVATKSLVERLLKT